MPEGNQNPVLEYGNQAVNKPVEDVVQKPSEAAIGKADNVVELKGEKGKAASESARPLIIIAGGYSGYKSPEIEIDHIKIRNWVPNTVDFETTARETGIVFSSAHTANEFFNILSEFTGYISKIIFIGHGNRKALGLAGDAEGVGMFTEKIDSETLIDFDDKIKNKIRPKISPGAEFVIIACKAAAEQKLVQSISDSFGIVVRAYSEPVEWCISYTKNEQTQVFRFFRGRLALESDVRPYYIEVHDEFVPPLCDHKVWKIGVKKMIPPVAARPRK